jgi:hypothetical protein
MSHQSYRAASFKYPVCVQGTSYRSASGVPGVTYKEQRESICYIPLSVAASINQIENAEVFNANFPGAVMGNLPRYSFRVGSADIVHMLTGEHLGFGGCAALVAECENSRMERYLAGTTSPLYDFLEELRYNPNSAIGPTFKRAAQSFTASVAAAAASDVLCDPPASGGEHQTPNK